MYRAHVKMFIREIVVWAPPFTLRRWGSRGYSWGQAGTALRYGEFVDSVMGVAPGCFVGNSLARET